jgi:flagellar biosynthesis protein FlhG
LEQNHYELLEVGQGGSERQLERAYRIARATFEPSSIATYSVFSEKESAEILRRVEEAYAVLSDARLRRDYDARLEREEQEHPQPESRSIERLADSETVWRGEPLRPEALEVDEALEPEDGVYDGVVLRRIRLELGIEIEEVATITKVDPHYLESVEANRYDDLPAGVYVRGFVKELAKCLGLDPKEVADSYMTGYGGAASGSG